MADWVRLLLLKAGAIPELLDNARMNLTTRVSQSRAATKSDALSESPFAGKLCIVTGANAGVGLDTSRALAQRGGTVIMACRSATRGEAAVQQVRASLRGCSSGMGGSREGDSGSSGAGEAAGAAAASGSAAGRTDGRDAAAAGSISFEQLDLSQLASVRAFVERVPRRPDLIICNAGIMAPETRQETPDGLEQQFQVHMPAVRGMCRRSCAPDVALQGALR